MTDDDPLAGRDDVPWAELQHSFGMADDVPGQLRAMQAGRGAWEGWYPPGMQLENHIVHQGTRSQAAVYTVPFLVSVPRADGTRPETGQQAPARRTAGRNRDRAGQQLPA